MALTQEQITAKFSARKLILPILLGLGVVGYMLYRNYQPGQLQTLVQASPFWLGMAFLVLFVRDFGYIYRIRYLTDKVLNWRQSFQVIMLWEFASCALPSVAGGSTIASYILFKEKIPLGKSIAQVMITALLDNLYFLLAVPMVLLYMKGDFLPDLAQTNAKMVETLKVGLIVSYILIAIYACSMFYALFINPKSVKRLLIRAGRISFLKRWRISLFIHANELLVASKHMHSKSCVYWIHASSSTVFVWTARYLIIGCLIAAFTNLSFNDHLDILVRNLLYKIVLFVSVTPGAAGFAELAFPAFFGIFIGSFTTIVILLYRLLTYYLYLVVGVLVFPRWVSRVYAKDENIEEKNLSPMPKTVTNQSLTV